MIRKNPRGNQPIVHESTFVDPTAILCGYIVVHENVFIGLYAVIRADEVDDTGHMEPIIVGTHSNIQDGVVIHSKPGASVTIGERTSITHWAIVHGPCFHRENWAMHRFINHSQNIPMSSKFSEDMARTNNSLVQGYKRIQNEL